MDFIQNLTTGINDDNILLNGSEKKIEKAIIKYFLTQDYNNYKDSYQQENIRVKNLNTSKPDVVLKKNDIVYLLEVKLQTDMNRAPIRFERAIIDILYLGNEVVRKNKLKTYFLFVDYTNNRYIEKNHLLESVSSLVKFNISKNLEWSSQKSTNVEYTIINVTK